MSRRSIWLGMMVVAGASCANCSDGASSGPHGEDAAAKELAQVDVRPEDGPRRDQVVSAEELACLLSGGCGPSCQPCRVPASGADKQCLPRHTFCPLERMECQIPSPQCQDGWCLIPAGSFIMGASRNELAPADLPTDHTVVLSRSFWAQQTEVTQRQWLEVMETSVNPSPYSACGPECPVSGVTAFAMMAYANRLSERQGLEPCYTLEGCKESDAANGLLNCSQANFAGPDCTGFRLPSEAEWELAAGASADTAYFTGCCDYSFYDTCNSQDELTKIGWFCGNAQVTCVTWNENTCYGPREVRQKVPNRFGLHDTAGNVQEVTGTLYSELSPVESPAVDPGFDLVIPGGDMLIEPQTSPVGISLVEKSGCFGCANWAISTYARGPFYWSARNLAYGYDGFRLVRTAAQVRLQGR